MKAPTENKSELIINKSVSELKEILSVGDVVCYFERESSNPMYRFGIIKSFWKRCGLELVSITDVRSDFTTFDNPIELSQYNFIVGLDIYDIYNYWSELNEKELEEVKKELKFCQQKLRDLKKSSHLNKRRFKDLVDSLQK